MSRLNFLLLVQLLLATSCLAATVVEKVTLDSINQDIEEIKRLLARNVNETSTAIRHSYGNFIEKNELEKDSMVVRCSKPSDGDNIYEYSIENLNQSLGVIKFSDFKGKPILIVNVATFCESTIEYPLYNQLKEKYGDDLVIVAFPSNQFWNVSCVAFAKTNKCLHLPIAIDSKSRPTRPRRSSTPSSGFDQATALCHDSRSPSESMSMAPTSIQSTPS